MPVSFRSEFFTSYLLTIFKQRNLLPYIWETAKYSYSCMYNITEKMYLLKMSGPQILLCLFTFRPIASKQLNGLTTIDTLSWLGLAVVTHLLWVQEVPGAMPGSSKGFLFVFLLCCSCCVFTFLSKNTLFVTNVCNSFYTVNLFTIINILQDHCHHCDTYLINQ